MSSQLPSVTSRLPLSIKKNTKRLVINFTKLIKESPGMWSRRRSNSFSAPTFSLTMIYPLAMSVNFQTPTGQQACTRHVSTRHQPLPNATSLPQLHVGIVSRNDHPHFSANTPGRQDQTCKLVLSQRPSALSPTNLWGILPWQRNIQQ